MRTVHGLLFWALGTTAGCGAILDFDDLEGLPCPCDDRFVCLQSSDRCVPRGSVDPFKSCSQDTNQFGNELCPPNHRCVAINDRGPRCLPDCLPVLYARASAGARVAEQCPFGTACWATPGVGGGVCSEGVCRDNPNNCPPNESCVLFNGAGICFRQCSIHAGLPGDCVADQTCHPIGLSNVTACVQTGNLPLDSICTQAQDGMCQKDTGGPQRRALICAKPERSTDLNLRCRPVCNPDDNTGCLAGETCVLVRANIDPFVGASVGLCEG